MTANTLTGILAVHCFQLKLQRRLLPPSEGFQFQFPLPVAVADGAWENEEIQGIWRCQALLEWHCNNNFLFSSERSTAQQ